MHIAYVPCACSGALEWSYGGLGAVGEEMECSYLTVGTINECWLGWGYPRCGHHSCRPGVGGHGEVSGGGQGDWDGWWGGIEGH